MNTNLLQVKSLSKLFPVERRGSFKFFKEKLTAVDKVSFDIKQGKTLGLVGESVVENRQ